MGGGLTVQAVTSLWPQVEGLAVRRPYVAPPGMQTIFDASSSPLDLAEGAHGPPQGAYAAMRRAHHRSAFGAKAHRQPEKLFTAFPPVAN